ncbi:MAG TPA: hypothetical protein VGS02_21065 [Acidobacteriaceae bacterium]|nr:hypothetical protein [Acidobacteriaceae bacterium]
MTKRREMGRDAADPRMHSETTTGRGETTGRQPGHIEHHESRSSAGNEAQVAGILHATDREAENDSTSSGRWSDESDAMSHESAHGQHEPGKSHPANVDAGESRQGAGESHPPKKRGRRAA